MASSTHTATGAESGIDRTRLRLPVLMVLQGISKNWWHPLSRFSQMALRLSPSEPRSGPHGEMFETLLLRTAGVETASALAAHEIPWTDPRVRNVLKIWQEMIEAGCCGDPNNMLALDWDTSSDAVLVSGESAYVIMGMWINGRARDVFGLTEGEDYALFQFPSLGLGFDDTSSVDAKEVLALSSGDNTAAADAFLAHLASPEAANIIAEGGLASPSNAVDASIYGPVVQAATSAVAESNVQFVLGDLLPGDLVDEYRVQLQRFLRDHSDENIDAVLGAIESKAQQFD